MQETGVATRGEPRELSTRVSLDLAETGHALAQASALAQLVETQFHEGHHFMRIPGTPMNQRPHLCDPGAGLIMTGYKVRTGGYRLLESVWDDENDHYSLAIEVSLVHIASGLVVSTGVGAATSHEVKYAYRWVRMEEVPAGLDRALLPTRIRKDGARMYRVDNPDLGDLYNTLWKMAAKRGEGDATLKLPGCSELFAGYTVNMPKRLQPKKDEPKPRAPEEVQRNVDELYDDEPPPAKPGAPKPVPTAGAPDPSIAGIKNAGDLCYYVQQKHKTKTAKTTVEFIMGKDVSQLATADDCQKAAAFVDAVVEALDKPLTHATEQEVIAAIKKAKEPQ